MEEEQQIIKRDNNSWLIDGSTPIEDLKHALEMDELPDEENYETLAGFMMYRLRKIPRPADFVEFGGYKFEVVDVDHFKIDQLLVTRVLEKMIYHLHLMKIDLFWCKISCKCRIFFDK